MTQPITLLLGVHAHQPVGNFPEVIADAHERCYRPFIHTLYAYPDFRFAAHFSGWLLDWLRERYPEDMALLAEMVRRGQLELFSSGDTEPVLAAIPYRDRVGQVERLSGKLAEWTGIRPTGAWLTERVWESSLVHALARTGVAYVTVDDYHFFCTGRQAAELDGFFSTEEGGVRLDLFPISEALRYRLPFSPAEEAVGFLEHLAQQGQSAAIYFDDIEKFGIWPETYDWVYTRGWLKAFIEGVLANPNIKTSTYADYHAGHPTRGIAYLPTTSYSEMNEWTLPMPAAADYAALLQQEKEAGRFERHRAFLRGGIWRNFLSRYGESNWMHKRMLRLSERLAALPAAAAELTDDLYRAQSNDAYWHGLFGGLYLPHLRRAVWSNLVSLEAKLDKLAPRPARLEADIDTDGRTEWLVHNDLLQVAVRDDGLAAPLEFSSYLLAHNFGDTLRRYAEHYHEKILHAQDSAHQGEGIASAHDIVRFKHPIEAADIVPDTWPRSLFLDRLNGECVGGYQPQDSQGTTLSFASAAIEKTLCLEDGALRVTWHCRGLAGRRFSTTLNLAMPSCDGFLGHYVLADGSIPGGFGQALELANATCLILDDQVLRGRVSLTCSQDAHIDGHPHHTVSQSEAGFEKIMQAVELNIAWCLPNDDCTLTIQLVISES